ncbi:hypothetical protein SAMN05443549_101241 [Flavobacterium fluvii]|uniref:CD-NTase associated protein 4-like DNA endonuclease domain-containing protein n=1 Tax=Flavobacterium fluvii TaxID=468056 RepID=A0A1M5E8T6_9FLAO|nr:hypothetical protein [Flavobacterium fluvii]SHF75649.1 hypothetical protein SAMN05443549_101241 [Flavobacterium fluvii]
MANPEIDVNSGVQANVGMDFQRNCSLYIFLEKYHTIKYQKYFIILEHYDDIVFGFLNNNDEIDKVETYQAKKSSTVWSNSSLYEIIRKIVDNGITLLSDDLCKSTIYTKNQFFITNNTIKLKYKNSLKNEVNVYINETNESVHFLDLPNELRELLLKGNSKIKFTDIQALHFSTLNFSYLDFGRNSKTQMELLIGKFQEVFGNSILDHKAARDTFIYELDAIDSKFNQNNIAKLSDFKKRLESTKVNEILDVITTHKLALEFCRQKSEKICEKLQINLFDSSYFELNFENSLDKFKDLTQSEHRKILDFVTQNSDLLNKHFNDVKCIRALYEKFHKDISSTLSEIQLKAAIAAAFYLIKTKQ